VLDQLFSSLGVWVGLSSWFDTNHDVSSF